MKVAIVDAYSTGNQIAKRLAINGASSFHIQSVDPIPKLLEKSYCNEDFNLNLIFNNDWHALLDNIVAQAPTHVIAGSETGVLLADKISNTLKLPGNDFALSEARRNKYLMLNAVKNAGLNSTWQLKENNLEILLSKLSTNHFPVVIKPVSSSSGDGFHICHNNADVSAAYNKIVGKLNILDQMNNEVLCQAFLEGTEYVVNSVSHEGRHYVTDIWEMQHRHTANIPMIIDSMTLLPLYHEVWQKIVEYTQNVLTALGIHFGPAHTEIMLTKNGPSLIEVNSRLMGGNIDPCFKEALDGYDQIDALIDSIVTPKQLHQRLQYGYHLNTCIAEVDFIFYESGTLQNFVKEKEIRSLETFKKFSKMPAIGNHVSRTSNTTNVEGLLYLIHEDYKKVIADRETVIAWQKDNLIFQIGNLRCQ